MREEVTITLYDIDRCGYYKWGQENPEFGELPTALSTLHDWARAGKPLGLTATFEFDADSHYDPTYCFEITRSSQTANYLLTTWNQVPEAEGGVASVDPSSQVGAAAVAHARFPANNIPGFPTYFYFFTEENLFATVVTGNTKNGQANMAKYIQGFLAQFSPFVVRRSDGKGEQEEVLGYRVSRTSDLQNLSAQFKTSQCRRSSTQAFIREHRSSIRKIVRKNTLVPKRRPDSTLLDRLLKFAGISGEVDSAFEGVRIRYEVSHTPTVEELNEMIAHWESDPGTKWDDVGFVLQGKSSVIWLGGTVARDKFTVDVNRTRSVLESSSLVSALDAARADILSLKQEQ